MNIFGTNILKQIMTISSGFFHNMKIECWYLCSVIKFNFSSTYFFLPRREHTGVNLKLWSECILCVQDLAMAGVRVGTVHSENRDLIEALDQLGSLHGVSGPTQYQVSQLLKDRGTISKSLLFVHDN